MKPRLRIVPQAGPQKKGRFQPGGKDPKKGGEVHHDSVNKVVVTTKA